MFRRPKFNLPPHPFQLSNVRNLFDRYRFDLLRYLTPNRLSVIAIIIAALATIFIFHVDDKKYWSFAFAAAIGVSGLIFNNAVRLHADAVSRTLTAVKAVDDQSDNYLKITLSFFRDQGGLDARQSHELFWSKDPALKKLGTQIILTLNFLEQLAIQDHFNLIDDEVLREYIGSSYVEYYELSAVAIAFIRGETEYESRFAKGKREVFFRRFEEMALRWKRRSQSKRRKSETESGSDDDEAVSDSSTET